MLARAAVRSLRTQIRPRPLRTISPSYNLRAYSKPGKLGGPKDSQSPTLSPPVNKSAPSAQEIWGSAQTATDGSSVERPQDQSGESSQGKTQGSLSADKAKTAPHSEDPTLQDEFQTLQKSDANTAPQSTSPSAIDPAEAQKQQERQPLPDLTQGIPSTLDAELGDRDAASKPASLNVTEDPSETAPGGGAGGELPKTAYISSLERRRNRLANWMYAILSGSAFVGTVYMGRNWETEEEELKHPDAPSGWGFGLFYNRANARLADTMNYFNEPTFPKLLPNVDPAWERPYTLVLSLEDLLVHSEWTREHGWRMAKRPGVDYFLRYLSQYYELVIFTSLPSMTGDSIIRKLDPYRIIMWPLYREATRYKGENTSRYVPTYRLLLRMLRQDQDLSYLNRDLRKVILLDTSHAHAQAQPENAIILPKWTGAPQDKELVSYIPFLEYVAAMGFDDIRDVLKSFQGKPIPAEFARRESIAREKFQKQLAEERAKRPKRSGVGFLGSALGLGKPAGGGMDGVEASLSEGFEQGKTLMDQVRERGQKQYEIMEKEIRENGQKWLEEMAAEEKKFQEEAMKNMKGGLLGMFSGMGGSKA